MSKNVFNATLDANNRVPRNSFDLTHSNNLTFNMGQIIPVMCKLMPPKSSIKIRPDFGLQLMPMVFPVQTDMRAQLSFYRVPLRTLWKDYRDYIGNFKKGLVPPYVNINTENKLHSMVSTGSLGDYLDLPTTFGGSFSQQLPLGSVFNKYCNNKTQWGTYAKLVQAYENNPTDFYAKYLHDQITVNSDGLASWLGETTIGDPSKPIEWDTVHTLGFEITISKLTEASAIEDVWRQNFHVLGVDYKNSSPGRFYDISKVYTVQNGGIRIDDVSISTVLGNSSVTVRGAVLGYKATRFPDGTLASNPVVLFGLGSNTPNTVMPYNNFNPSCEGTFTPMLATVQELTLETSPYYNSNSDKKDKQIALSALPFRAYEAIYNAYMRDNRNNPFVLNGQKEYNVWIPTDAGGLDNTTYAIRYKNWQPDFLTTAVPSPQQGIAPLVGLTTYTRTDENGVQSAAFSIRDEDGRDFRINLTTNAKDGKPATAVTGVSYTPLSADESATVHSRPLLDAIQSGISIADLRNVNAYQKYLEMNMRKGYSYRDVIEGHFDSKVRFDELLMPEYIGGVSEFVKMNAITQTVETSTSGAYAGSLGSQSGLGGVRGRGDNSITCYCDEESYIIGVISLVPTPCYSQLLPKHWLHRDLLDSFYPEFDNIGFQPITYKEVCPIQAFNDNPDTLNTTFGYQRPWYDYVSETDKVHGLFRTNLRNFLVNRVFDHKPQLSESFLLVDPNQVNDVFSVTESSHKIYGQIRFDTSVQLPISRTAIPKLD